MVVTLVSLPGLKEVKRAAGRGAMAERQTGREGPGSIYYEIINSRHSQNLNPNPKL